jgi:hypothetical protein
VVEGALEAARKDNAKLQHEVAGLRSTLRRGGVEDAPAPLQGEEAAEAAMLVKRARAGGEPPPPIPLNKI